MQALEDRFMSKVVWNGDEDECWTWEGSTDRGGYGRFSIRHKVGAHRFAYELFVGPIPEGLVLDHLCRNHACVNPAHLEPVTHAENCRRGEVGNHLAAKTHCPAGHPYSGDNLYVDPRGKRYCRNCQRGRVRTRRKVARERA